jgi:hypothetical protein
MADTKISALASLSGASAAGADAVPIADVSAATTKAITLTELTVYLAEKFGLTDLSDATIATPATGHVLEYTGAGWQNVPLADSVVVVDPTGFATSSHTNLHSVLVDIDSAITIGGISSNIVDAAGDLIVGTADNTVARLAKGSNYESLTLNGSGALDWADPRGWPVNVNTQTGTTYTTVLGDAGKLVTCSNAGTITLTVPPAASVAYPAGTIIDVAQYGAGQVTVAAGAGVTIQTSSTLKLRTQWSTASLVLTATADTWVLVGDLEPLGQTLNAQTGTTYSLVIGDAWKLITLSNAGAITLTIPANASVAFPIGTHIDIMQLGAGQVTTTITSDTLRSTPTAKTRAQYSMATLIKIASTTWVISGDLATS